MTRKTLSAKAVILCAAALAVAACGAAHAKPSKYTRARPNTVVFGKIATTAPVNMNTAGKPELAPLTPLSSEAKSAILNFRAGGPYVDGTDFASKVCSRVAVDFGATDIQIGTAVYHGFACLIVADGAYQADGSSHVYALPVEDTGSATVRPAPPAQ